MVGFLADSGDEISFEVESNDLFFVGLTTANELDVATGRQGSMIDVLVFADVFADSVVAKSSEA